MNDLPVRVVLADDHPMFRFGVAAALASVPEIDVVGEAADGAELINLVERLRPDVVVTDLTMPGVDGASACATITSAHPEIGVLALTMHADDETVVAALRAGARGYVLKGADRRELVRAIHTVADGQAFYGAAIAGRIAMHVGRPAVALPLPTLTPRERDVLTLLADGARNSVIARELGMTEKTVRNHVSSILGKLHVPDRTAAAIKAREAGLAG